MTAPGLREGVLPLLDRLTRVEERAAAANELARTLGARAALFLVRDPEVEVLLPAPGFAPTLPGGAAWRALLARCAAPGPCSGEVPYPAGGPPTPVAGWVSPDGTAFLFLGGTPALLELSWLPWTWLGAALQAEQVALSAAGDAASAKDAAREARALTIALDRARGELQQSLRVQRDLLGEKERLLSIVGHDLRNPLSAILAGTDLLLRHSVSDAQQKSLKRIRGSAQRMSRMISDLMDFERIRQGGFEIARTPSLLKVIVESVVEELEVANPTRRIDLRVATEGAGDWDVGRISQMVSNLVGNALQHSPADSDITVSLSGSQSDFTIEISNRHRDGPIPAAELPQLFDPFRRGKGSTGLGLGLHIVQQICREHGGSVAAESSSEQTTFRVRLPRQSRPAA